MLCVAETEDQAMSEPYDPWRPEPRAEDEPAPEPSDAPASGHDEAPVPPAEATPPPETWAPPREPEPEPVVYAPAPVAPPARSRRRPILILITAVVALAFIVRACRSDEPVAIAAPAAGAYLYDLTIEIEGVAQPVKGVVELRITHPVVRRGVTYVQYRHRRADRDGQGQQPNGVWLERRTPDEVKLVKVGDCFLDPPMLLYHLPPKREDFDAARFTRDCEQNQRSTVEIDRRVGGPTRIEAAARRWRVWKLSSRADGESGVTTEDTWFTTENWLPIRLVQRVEPDKGKAVTFTLTLRRYR